MQIRQIIDKINEKQLFVPAFQREYVWKKRDAKALFHSLIKDYPTGTMLTWETNNPPELKGEVQHRPEMGSVKLILDGQQRITTIYMIMTGEIPPYYSRKEIVDDVRGLYVNLDTLELEYYKARTMANNPLWQELKDVFEGDVRTRRVLPNDIEGVEDMDALHDRVDDNINRIRAIEKREFVEQMVPITADIKTAIDIFYIVNASGVNLTEAELALAQICGYWPDARKVFKKKQFELAEEGFVFKLDFIIYALLGMLYTMGSDMRRLHSSDNKERIQSAWERLDKRILDYTVNLLRSHAYIDHSSEINSVYALVPIIKYIDQKEDGRLTQLEIKKVVKWYYYSQILQRYISTLPQKLDKDLTIVANDDNPFDKLISNLAADRRLNIVPEDFVNRDVRHPLFNLMKCYFKSKEAVCLGTGVKLHKNMGKQYALENDHIFAFSLLRDNGYSKQDRFKYPLAQEITNRAILTGTENRSKSNEKAELYLAEVKERFPGALKLQCIPENEMLWKLENYELFLEERRKILATELTAFLDNITKIDLAASEVSLEQVIQEGENSEVEFKETMRWDTREGRISKTLEGVILKTIAAFSNAEGGTLIIGVSDDGEIMGLDRDYSTFPKSSDKDGFELHLQNLLINAYGVQFASGHVKVTFPEVNGNEICVIDVHKGHAPVYTEAQNKSGSKAEKFYVRSGNSSREIEKPSEIASYCETRFSLKKTG
jgi:hypothetical protein